MGLEDALGDVVGKAMRGNKVSAETLADKTGLTAGQVQQMLAYKYTPPDDQIATIARALELNYRGLVRIAHDSYSPTAPGLDKWPNLAAWSSNYDNFSVNAFMAWDTETK
ncbi:MAG: helix-turn-helix transcriptional regulator, partial [Armatimonadota bacterium]